MKKMILRYRSWNLPQKTGFWLICAMFCYTLVGFLLAPPILKAVLEKKLPEILGRPVTIESIRLNPYALSATVEGFDLGQAAGQGSFVAFDRFYVNLEILSIFEQALVVRSLSLEGPKVAFSRLADNHFSFSDLLEARTGSVPPEETRPLRYSVNNIEISRGEIIFSDQPMQKQHQVKELELAIPSISNLPVHVQVTVEPRFSALINGTPLALDGGSKPFAASKATDFAFEMTGIEIPGYLSYLPNPTGLTLQSGLLDLDTLVAFQIFPNQSSRLSVTGRVTLRELEVVDREGASYLRVPRISAVLADTNLLHRQVRLSELDIQLPQIEVIRRADGELLPLVLLSRPAEPALIDVADESAPEPAEAAPLELTFDRIRLSGGEVGFTDRTLAEAARLVASGIDLTIDNLSTIPQTTARFELALELNRAGTLGLDGSLVPEPLHLKTALRLEQLGLKPFQPYVSEYARVAVADGRLDLAGDLSLARADDGSPALSFSGRSSLIDLLTADTVTGGELVKWKALEVDGIQLASPPLTLVVGKIALERPFAQVLVRDDGTLNLATLGKPSAPSEPTVDAVRDAVDGQSSEAGPESGETLLRDGEAPRIHIAEVVLREGVVQFEDRAIEPSYGVTLDQLGGSISGLSSDRDSQATVDLKARVDQQSPLSITGTLNPLSETPTADIKLDFTGFNLTPLSPYTGKYIGYRTGKGKLHLDLAYLIEGSRLDSSNRIFLDQFTLGQSVDSPDAISAPVGLAVALLKNRSGEITLDIPVVGDLDDPEFSVAGVIVQVIFNLIAKAATSPFALLGALIPEGVDIQHIPFDPGAAELNQAALEKLEVVSKVLIERPGVRMDLAGRVDPRLDRAALARERLLQRVKLAKIQWTGAKQPAADEVPRIDVSAVEYPEYLERAYRAALKDATAAERDAAAARKPADEAEKPRLMEEFLLKDIEVSDADLRLLAIERANQVLSHLVEASQVEADRLFVVEPQLQPPEGDAEVADHALVQLLIR